MTDPSSPPAPMTAESYSIERIRRAQILEPVGAQQFAQHTYASDIRALLEQYDALTARVAELERERESWLEACEAGYASKIARAEVRAQAAEAKLESARRDALEEAAAICKQFDDCGPNFIAEKIRALQTKDTP